MYKLVRTPEDLVLFNSIKNQVWSEKGFEMEYGTPASVRFLFYVGNQPAGTFEYTDLRYARPHIQQTFQPLFLPQVKVVETDSFAVLPQFRGKLGREIVSHMVEFTRVMGFSYGVGLADEKIVKSFPKTYGITTTAVGKPFVYLGEVVTPVVFDFTSVHALIVQGKCDWFIQPVEYIQQGQTGVRR